MDRHPVARLRHRDPIPPHRDSMDPQLGAGRWHRVPTLRHRLAGTSQLDAGGWHLNPRHRHRVPTYRHRVPGTSRLDAGGWDRHPMSGRRDAADREGDPFQWHCDAAAVTAEPIPSSLPALMCPVETARRTSEDRGRACKREPLTWSGAYPHLGGSVSCPAGRRESKGK